MKISHLLSADNSLIFTRASLLDFQNVKRIFDCYAAASSQLFNFEKSSMFFSSNIQEGHAAAIKNIFQLKVVSSHEMYLGLPSMIRRSSFFNNVKLKVLGRISNWQHKFFSCGGKEVLIKAVAQAVPAYAISIFKIPMRIYDDTQKVIDKFWWGSKKEKKGIYWVRWERLSQAKSRGGLGFREFSSFNQA